MELIARPLITAGVAALATGLITATPVTPPVPHIQQPTVQLTAESDFFTVWADVLDRAATNVTALGTDLVTPPLPVLQQITVNQVGFLQDFLQNPSDIWNIFGQIWNNVVTGVTVPYETDTSLLDAAHRLMFGTVSGLLPVLAPNNTELAQWLLDFSATPFSGWLIGEVGMFVSPWLELRDSIGSIVGAIRDDDWAGAWNDLVNIPAHMTDGWLNGYGTVDLMSLLGSLLPELPIGTIRSLDIDLGGMLSPGGMLFGGIGADVCTTLPIVGCVSVPPFPVDGVGYGPLGSLIEISQVIAQSLGWDGIGNPIDALLADPT